MPPRNDRRCSIEGCDARHVARGYCGGHYQQVRLGKPITPLIKSLPHKERFMAKVEVRGDCWEWTAYQTEDGYGMFGMDSRLHTAQRASWLIFRGAIPESLEIDHMCHNRACVNPDHLQLVTRKQNMENQAGAHANSRTGVRGVWLKGNRYVGAVRHDSRTYHTKRFDSIEEAERAVVELRNSLHTNNLLDRKTP